MTTTSLRRSASFLLVCGISTVALAGPAAKTTPAPAPPPEPPPIKSPDLARMVQYGPRDTVLIQTKPGYTSMVVLPSNERILTAVLGDKDFWELDATVNMFWVKPAKKALDT